MAKIGRPMLAMREPPEEIEYPALASFKLDGFRALANDRLYTRKLKLIRNEYTQDLFGGKLFQGFDGELIVGEPTAKGVFQRTSSGVTSRDGMPKVKFYVFDLWNRPGVPFAQRFAELKARIEAIDDFDCLTYVEQQMVRGRSEMQEYEAEALSRGYEGLILRTRGGLYVNKRCGKQTPYMWKLKRFTDGEMRVTGYELEMENLNPKVTNELGLSKRSSHKENKRPKKGVVGVILGKDLKTGQDVRVGSGMRAKQKRLFFKMFQTGEMQKLIVKYKHFEQSGVKDKRRHSIFMGIRDRSDL